MSMASDEIIKNITSVLMEYPVKRAALFGSYARGDFSDISDIDMIVDFTEGVSLVENYYDLYDSLEERLGRKIDLLCYGSVQRDMMPVIRNNILQDLRWFYES